MESPTTSEEQKFETSQQNNSNITPNSSFTNGIEDENQEFLPFHEMFQRLGSQQNLGLESSTEDHLKLFISNEKPTKDDQKKLTKKDSVVMPPWLPNDVVQSCPLCKQEFFLFRRRVSKFQKSRREKIL